MPLIAPELPFRAPLAPAGAAPAAVVRLAVPGAAFRAAAGWAPLAAEPGFFAPAPDRADRDGWRLTAAEGEPGALLDRFAIALWDGAAHVPLTAEQVEVGVLEAVWHLATSHGAARVRVVALEADAAGNAGLALELAAPSGLPQGAAWHVRPWLPAEGTWMVSADAEKGCLTGLRGDWGLFVGAATPASAVHMPARGASPIDYPRGEGEASLPGAVSAPESRPVRPLGTLELDASSGPARVLAVAGPASRADQPAWEAARARLETALGLAVGRLVSYETALGAALPAPVRARAGRAAGGFPDAPLPERLEFALQSHRTLYAMGAGPALEAELRAAFDLVDPATGRLPRHLGLSVEARERFERFGALPEADYAPEHATLTALALAEEIENRFDNPGLLWAMWQGFLRLLAAMKHNRPFSRLGGPVLTEDGLLMAPADRTWADGLRAVSAEGLTVSGVPQRLPRAWVAQDLLKWRDAHLVAKEHRQATVLLPDLNARWLKALAFARRLAGRFTDPAAEQELDALLDAARIAYPARFRHPETGLLVNLATLDGRVDPTFTAFALEAAALLPEAVLPPTEARRHFQAATERLLIRRAGRPFAFACKESPAPGLEPHEAGAWLRQTAYWLRLAGRLGETALLKEACEAHLAHELHDGGLGDASSWGLRHGPEGTWVPVGEPSIDALFCDAFWEAGL